MDSIKIRIIDTIAVNVIDYTDLNQYQEVLMKMVNDDIISAFYIKNAIEINYISVETNSGFMHKIDIDVEYFKKIRNNYKLKKIINKI